MANELLRVIYILSNRVHSHAPSIRAHIGCSALLCAKFLSNPRRIHSGQKDEEKEGYELLWAVICYKPPPSTSPTSPLPPHCASVAPPAAMLSGLEGWGRAPPPHTPPPPHRIMDRFWQPHPKSRMASVLETVSMIAEFGQQQWSCTNFWCSDRTLRSRDRIFEFSQEMVKICAAAWILDTRANFDRSVRYNQLVQYGRDAAHKSRAAWAIRSLEVYMSERQHIYEDLNESSSARPGGSQQLEVLPSTNSKRTPNFSADILVRRRSFT